MIDNRHAKKVFSGNPCGGRRTETSGAGLADSAGAVAPVSYTHLDVYKRQVVYFWRSGSGLGCSAEGHHDPVSYTHLDVYKRQS